MQSNISFKPTNIYKVRIEKPKDAIKKQIKFVYQENNSPTSLNFSRCVDSISDESFQEISISKDDDPMFIVIKIII